ncbi:hypothetical protein MKX01_034684 [Papaver californicum]|nr:hypothetical protein MKX01_034684 [Papaver californicum]
MNATKVFFNLSISEVLDMRERSFRITPARQITLPGKNKQPVIDLTMPDNTKTISELLECKWKPNSTASLTRVLTNNGWYYWGGNKCTTKVVGEVGDYGCTRCENKVADPIPKCLLRFKVTDHTGTALFTALNNKVQHIVRATAHDMVILREVHNNGFRIS